ncbi:MAG: SDR family oxidoreductase [Gammaproteobacteria bacterium]|nr:SDR family oxidoreductase [Gammaproteobacteria bacterium]MCI0590165.1 SDR family oxidoreductase [Gammaproteobacteria bacterium]
MTKDLFDITDRVVLITGGLGQLGCQFTRALLDRGAKVAVLDVRADEAMLDSSFEDAVDDGRLLVVATDVTERKSIEEALVEVNARLGVPYGLINNAALDAPPDALAEENGPLETYPSQSWDTVMAVNVKGVFQACQVVGGQMADSGRGSIINVSSIYGLVAPDQRLYEYRQTEGKPFFKPVSYATSKSALFNLTRYLATYWAGRGVRANTVTFGGVFNNQDQRFLEHYSARVPLGRMAREEEYNGAIVFLLSEASSYMTGANLVVDGGWTAW